MQSVLFLQILLYSNITYETSLYCLILTVCLFFLSTFVSGFWELRPQTPTGALLLDPAGGLLSPRPTSLSPTPLANSWPRPWMFTL